MIRKNVRAYALFAVASFCVAAQGFAESRITADLKGTIDEVLEIIADKSLERNPTARREKLRRAIGARFSYKQMVMRTLAKNYKERSDAEREEFTVLFKRLLENSYVSKIESYQSETINYVSEKVRGKYALVETQIVRKAGVVRVDYKMLKENDQWLIYDFVIEGVSLVRNYRSQFSKIISTESYATLVKKLSKKVAEIEVKGLAAGENF